MTKNHIRVTSDRLSDYRSCLKEIIDAKNGKVPKDSVDLLPAPEYTDFSSSKKRQPFSKSPLKKTIEMNMNLNQNPLAPKRNSQSSYMPT